MSHYEYLDIDRKTVTKEKSDSTVAKRYVYDGATSEHPQRHYVGAWRPVEGCERLHGVILHGSEIEADDSPRVRAMCLRRATQNITALKEIVASALQQMEESAREAEKCQRWLHWYESQLERLVSARSLREMLRIRVERRPVDGKHCRRV